MFDFDEIIDRRGTGSLKWNVAEGELPMWVADMDFRTAPCVTDAIRKRLDHGIFGYSETPDEWYDAYVNWWKTRHGYEFDRNQLTFCTGVVPAISSIVRKLTTPNENVLIQTPVYNIFFNSIVNNGCRAVESPLVYMNGEYHIDFDDLEKKMADPQTTLMILCNPHNPVGKIWSREDLKKIGEAAYRNGVIVIADEIHCDITRPGTSYIPFASVSDICEAVSITCIAPTKTFNIAGIQTAAVFAKDRKLFHKVWRALNTDEVAEPNAFACDAAVAAFSHGGVWLDELRKYLFDNRDAADEYLRNYIPSVHSVRGDATYLMWIDISYLSGDSVAFCRSLRENTGLFVSNGRAYGNTGNGFIRVNIACPKKLMLDGFDRLKRECEKHL